MAAREVSRGSARSNEFASRYFKQVHKSVKELEHIREEQQPPQRQPVIVFQPESSGSQVAQTEIQAAEGLQHAADGIDNAAEYPEAVAVAQQLQEVAAELDEIVYEKLRPVGHRLSYAAFQEAVTNVFARLPQLRENVRQLVMAVIHVGAGFYLQEERNRGAGVHGTIQNWPGQYFEENPQIMQAVQDAGGMDSVLGSSVD